MLPSVDLGWEEPRPSLESKKVGLYMANVYFWMSGGIAVSSLVAMFLGQNPDILLTLFGSPLLATILFVVPFIGILVLGRFIEKIDAVSGGLLYLMITAVMGTWLGGIAVQAFEDPVFAQNLGLSMFTASGMFVGMSLYGWITRKDLSGWGTFFIASLWGLIALTISAIFISSSWFHLGISFLGVLIFAGLIAYDTQKLKEMFEERGHHTGIAIVGALNLYLDFVNLVLHLARLFGGGGND